MAVDGTNPETETSASPAGENLPLKVGGTVFPGRHVYIKRPQDDELFETLMRHEYANVLSSRQVGKSRRDTEPATDAVFSQCCGQTR